MFVSEFQKEVSEARVAEEIANLSRAANMAVVSPGADECVDCGDAIGEARKKAAPFATRCIQCQLEKESQ